MSRSIARPALCLVLGLQCLAVRVASGQTASDEAVRPDAVSPGHSMQGEAFDHGPRQAAYLMGGTGRVKFAVSTKSPLAQQFFAQGLGQLHGFWYWEAERTFRQAAAIDPDCAMAYWGMAMANVNNSDRALKFIRQAVKKSANASRHETAFIAALSEYCEDWARSEKNEEQSENASGGADEASERATAGNSDRKKDQPDPKKAAEKKRKEAYLNRLQKIAEDFPDDLEAKAFLAYYRWSWRDDVPIGDHEAVETLLKSIFDVEPMHPAHHYRIHLWDDKAPERALASAALCGQAAPSIAHMWHMPGHIYWKLARYDDAAYQQEASARVDHAYMLRDRVMPFQIHNYAHNNEWLVRSLINVGRVRDAVNLSKNLIETPRHPKLNSPAKSASAASYGRERLIETIVLFELWSDYIALAHTPYLAPGDSEADQVKHIRWLGAAHLGLGNQVQGEQQLAELTKRLNDLKNEREQAGQATEGQSAIGAQTGAQSNDGKTPEKAKTDEETSQAGQRARADFKKRAEPMEKAIAHLHALQAAAAGDHAAAVELFEQAGDLPKPHMARAYLRAGDKEKAEKLAREAVDQEKSQVYPLANYVQVLHAVGKDDDAKQAFAQLRALAGSSDLKAPIFDQFEDIVAAWGYTAPWKLPHKEAADVGLRPPLASLGPLLWQPAAAPRWILPNSEGETVALASYGGRPVIVIFYLGYGCLECARQLKAFEPLAKEFHEAGIQLVAISTDSVEELRRSVEEAKREKTKDSPESDAARPDPSARDAGEKSASPADRDYPFTLLSNADLRAFRAYGAYDDFEQRPLHGTFLIDGGGNVRWQDVGAAPFTDATFLLDEAKRVMALPR